MKNENNNLKSCVKENEVKFEVFIVSDNIDDYMFKDRVARLSKMFYFGMFNNLF